MIGIFDNPNPSSNTITLITQFVKESISKGMNPGQVRPPAMRLPKRKSNQLWLMHGQNRPTNLLDILLTPFLGTDRTLTVKSLATSSNNPEGRPTSPASRYNLTWVNASIGEIQSNREGSKLVLEGACRFVCTISQVAPSRLESRSRNLDPMVNMRDD